jgi:hypothetical protein
VQCPLKVESEPTLKALAAANHMLMMITGEARCQQMPTSYAHQHVEKEAVVAGQRISFLHACLHSLLAFAYFAANCGAGQHRTPQHSTPQHST